MSLITQCPACATMFRVVPDQLRISEGWVRCGQCDEVFDANAHMQTVQHAPAVAASDVEAASQAPAFAEISDPLDPASSINAGYDWSALAEHHAPQDSASAPPDIPATEGADAAEEHFAQPPVGLDEDLAGAEPYLEPSHLDLPLMEDAMATQYVPPHEELSASDAMPAESHPEVEATSAPLEDVPLSFMPAAERPPSRLGKVFGKRVMAGLCSGLVLLLGAQWVMAERDRVAAVAPGTRPVLETVCGWLQCSVSAPRQIESISIDSSAFTSIKPGVYLLNVTLKNAATLALACPALELTLTDMQDRPLFRRVISAEEFSGKAQTIDAGAELSSSIPVAVRAGTAVENIAGYKLLAFYP